MGHLRLIHLFRFGQYLANIAARLKANISHSIAFTFFKTNCMQRLAGKLILQNVVFCLLAVPFKMKYYLIWKSNVLSASSDNNSFLIAVTRPFPVYSPCYPTVSPMLVYTNLRLSMQPIHLYCLMQLEYPGKQLRVLPCSFEHILLFPQTDIKLFPLTNL